MKIQYYLLLLLMGASQVTALGSPVEQAARAFPFILPKEKPDRPLSAAMERSYTAYMAPRPEHNELYSQFKYTKLEGFDYNGGDGTISRRDPSKIIFENGKYYVWYTKRHTAVSPQGRRGCTDTVPSQDWDLADVWYATSKDGFRWKEEGVAIPKPPQPHPGWRAVCTPGVLKWEGQFYLYYQAFLEPSGQRGDDCPIAVSVADSPDGPWTPVNRIILPTGAKGEWDQYAVQDPNPLVHDGKIAERNQRQPEKAVPQALPFRVPAQYDKAHVIAIEQYNTWVLDERFSDEFNTQAVDEQKWEKDLRPWGERAWSSDNVFLRDGKLVIRAHYEPHRGRREAYFYKLGILRSRQKTTYGYFEARIKGCSRFPGLCPGFWLYSYGKERNPKFPKVAYSEIDIIELQQGLYNPALKRKVGVNHIDLNLHTRLLDEHGREQWVRPNDAPEICRGFWEAPWDPRDDFHIYACENTSEKITWYIDGVKVSEKKNLYWHLPMSVTFTMELRPPLIAWAGVDGRVPVPEAATAEGFPTEMEVDYVRCWRHKE